MKIKAFKRAIGVLGILSLFCLMLLPVGCGLPKAPAPARTKEGYYVTDYQGNQVYIPHKPQRILAGNVAVDTMLLGLTTADHLIVVNTVSRNPMSSFIADYVKEVPYTNYSLTGIQLETIVAAKPDLVLVPDWTSQTEIKVYQTLGYPVVVLKGPDSVEEIQNDIRLIGKAIHEEERADTLIRRMNEQMEKVEHRLARVQGRRPVGLIISRMSTWGGEGSLFDEICHLSRIKNGIAEAGIASGQELSKESVIKARPDFFMVPVSRKGDISTFHKEWLADPALSHLEGVHHIVPIPNRYIYCVNQNIPYAVEAIANAAYGDLFDMTDEHLIRGF